MELPNKFKFTVPMCNDQPNFYEAEKIDNKWWNVSWKSNNIENRTRFSNIEIERLFESGDWVMILEKCNGVDKDGNDLNFSIHDLKPFQRFKTKNGEMWIVAPHSFGMYQSFGIRHDESWTPFTILPDINALDFNAVEVYAVPNQSHKMLDPNSYGDLIWKYIDQSNVERKEFLMKEIDSTMNRIQKSYEEAANLNALHNKLLAEYDKL
jgi:hypothetical protein